jgi:hypothetical protein
VCAAPLLRAVVSERVRKNAKPPSSPQLTKMTVPTRFAAAVVAA